MKIDKAKIFIASIFIGIIFLIVSLTYIIYQSF